MPEMCPADPVHLCKVVTLAKKSRTAIPKAARPVRASRHSRSTATGHCPSLSALSHSSQPPWSHPCCLQHCKATIKATNSQRVHKMLPASFNTSNASFDISCTKFAKFAIPDCTDHRRETLISLHCILHLIQIINAPLSHFLSCFISFC